MIKLSNLEFVSGGKAWLQVPALNCRQGERVALLGPSGSGKTTLLRAMLGLIKPDKGLIHLQQSATMLFQKPVLLRCSVLSNLRIAAFLAGLPHREGQAKALHWLNRLDIGALAPLQAYCLSGGQQQRVAFARAMLKPVTIVLLDEPSANLDLRAQQQLEASLDRRYSVIFSSHDTRQVERWADRVYEIDQGMLLERSRE
jgi:tungstate transport system ATP-binding protein